MFSQITEAFRAEQYLIKVCLDVQSGISVDHQPSGALINEVNKVNLNETYSTKEFFNTLFKKGCFFTRPKSRLNFELKDNFYHVIGRTKVSIEIPDDLIPNTHLKIECDKKWHVVLFVGSLTCDMTKYVDVY